MGGRSRAETEAIAIEWAKKGIATVKNILVRGGKRVLTVDEFVEKWGAHDRYIYADLKAAIPDEWHEALKQQQNIIMGEHTWWRSRTREIYTERWTEETENPRREITWTQEYEREKGSTKLKKRGAIKQGKGRAVSIGDIECIVRRVKTIQGITPHATEGGTREMTGARAVTYSHEVVCEESEHAPTDPLQIAIQQEHGRIRRLQYP